MLVSYVGGPRGLDRADVPDDAHPEFEPAVGGRYRLHVDPAGEATYRFEVGFDEPEPADAPSDVVHVRPKVTRTTTRSGRR